MPERSQSAGALLRPTRRPCAMALSDAGRGALGEAASSLGYALEEPVDEEEARVAAASLRRKLQRARAGIGPTVASDVALLPMELAAFDVAAKRVGAGGGGANAALQRVPRAACAIHPRLCARYSQRRRQAADDLQWRVPEDPNARVPEEPHIVVDGIDVTRFGYDTLLRAREGTLRRGDDERARREFEALTRQVRGEESEGAVGGNAMRRPRALPALSRAFPRRTAVPAACSPAGSRVGACVRLTRPLCPQAAEEQVRAQQLARLVARERLQGAEGENGGARGGEQRDRGRRGGRRGVQERRR